jgi:protein phosphatase
MSTIELAWGARTEVGKHRRSNEDALIAEFPVFLVADGMGGHEAGDVASERALAAFRPLVGHQSVSLEDFSRAFHEAAREVAAIQVQRAAGTTISGVAVSENGGVNYWLVLNIGDSRTYRLANGRLEQISVDHSVVQELIDEGRLAPAQAEQHPERHVITKAVGAGSRAEPDYWLIPATSGDRLLICSDGLSKEVAAEEIGSILAGADDPQSLADRLVETALLHGGHDNISVIVVDAVTATADEFPTVPNVEAEPGFDTVPRLVAEEGAQHGGQA